MNKIITFFSILILIILSFFLGVKYSDSIKSNSGWLFENVEEEEIFDADGKDLVEEGYDNKNDISGDVIQTEGSNFEDDITDSDVNNYKNSDDSISQNGAEQKIEIDTKSNSMQSKSDTQPISGNNANQKKI